MENNENAAVSQAEQQPSKEDLKKVIETLLFITDRPLSLARLSQDGEVNNIELTREIIEDLRGEYISTGRSMQILEIGGGYQMATKPEYGRWVRKLFNEKMSARLSPAAMETLAIIAYKQPVTRAEIEAIRGVDIVGPLERLMERGLVRVVGKKDTPGRPMVYGTTEEFLRAFGLNKLSELPEIATFAAKGLREVQSDLPFSEILPDLKDNIIPLTEEEALLHNYSHRHGLDLLSDDLPEQGQTPGDSPVEEQAEDEAVAAVDNAEPDAEAATPAPALEETADAAESASDTAQEAPAAQIMPQPPADEEEQAAPAVGGQDMENGFSTGEVIEDGMQRVDELKEDN